MKRILRKKQRVYAVLVGALMLMPASVTANDFWWIDQYTCRLHLPGAYLATIKDSQGDFASRAVLMIHKDRNLSVADSAQIEGRFGHQQGSYRCITSRRAKAITLNFGFTLSDEENIARSDWVINISQDRNDRNIFGEVTVNLHEPLETCDPLSGRDLCSVTSLGTFTFTAVRIEPPTR